MQILAEQSPLVGEPGNHNLQRKNGRKCGAHSNSTFFYFIFFVVKATVKMNRQIMHLIYFNVI